MKYCNFVDFFFRKDIIENMNDAILSYSRNETEWEDITDQTKTPLEFSGMPEILEKLCSLKFHKTFLHPSTLGNFKD